MSGAGHNGQLRALVERIERIEEEIAEMNSDKSEVYQEAKAHGYQVKVLRKVVAARRKDPSERQEEDALFDLYMSALDGSEPLVRARVENIEEIPPHDAGTGEMADADGDNAQTHNSHQVGRDSELSEQGAVAAPVPTQSASAEIDLTIPEFLRRSP